MRLLAGTSGFAFKEWKGSFYPADLPPNEMLGYYAGRFRTVEVNNTFYRLPRQQVLLDWAAQVPDEFTFAVKASQRITHHARLNTDSRDLVGYLLSNTAVLGSRLGPLLFQLPPTMAKDVDRLRTFLTLLPVDRRFAFEFRHSSWFDHDVAGILRERNIALCITDQADFTTPPIATADWGYMRLHRLDYTDAVLREWLADVREHGWDECYVYFKHDEAGEREGVVGSGPAAVEAFLTMSNSGSEEQSAG